MNHKTGGKSYWENCIPRWSYPARVTGVSLAWQGWLHRGHLRWRNANRSSPGWDTSSFFCRSIEAMLCCKWAMTQVWTVQAPVHSQDTHFQHGSPAVRARETRKQCLYSAKTKGLETAWVHSWHPLPGTSAALKTQSDEKSPHKIWTLDKSKFSMPK